MPAGFLGIFLQGQERKMIVLIIKKSCMLPNSHLLGQALRLIIVSGAFTEAHDGQVPVTVVCWF